MYKIVPVAVLALAVLATGCASITNDSSTPLRLETYTQAGVEVTGMDCTVESDYGAKTVKTPGSLLVHRSSKDLQISCVKAGEPDAKGSATSRVNGGMFGNILIGGVIGAVIDHSTGNGYTYPQWMRLVVDKFLIFDRRQDKDGAPNLGSDTLGGASAAAQEPRLVTSANPGPSKPLASNAPANVSVAAPVAVAVPAPAPVSAIAISGPAKPAASAINSVSDADKVPLSKEGRDEYRQWLTKPLPRAFAVAPNGVWLATWGTKPQNTALPSNPSERAMQACQNRAKEACKLYAVDNEVVWGVK